MWKCHKCGKPVYFGKSSSFFFSAFNFISPSGIAKHPRGVGLRSWYVSARRPIRHVKLKRIMCFLAFDFFARSFLFTPTGVNDTVGVLSVFPQLQLNVSSRWATTGIRSACGVRSAERGLIRGSMQSIKVSPTVTCLAMERCSGRNCSDMELEWNRTRVSVSRGTPPSLGMDLAYRDHTWSQN